MQTYQMRVSRLERVGGQIQPEEEILLSIQARSQGRSAGMGEWTEQGTRGHLLERARPADDFRSHAVDGDSTACHEDPGR